MLLLAVICLGTNACAGSRQMQTSDSHPDDLSVSLGRGGGFTGMWEGLTVEAGGTVLRWSGFVERDDERPAGTLSASQMAEIWQRLNRDDLLNQDLAESGNMTSFIEVTTGGETRRLRWEVGTEADNDLASAAAATYRDIREMIEAGVAGDRP